MRADLADALHQSNPVIAVAGAILILINLGGAAVALLGWPL